MFLHATKATGFLFAHSVRLIFVCLDGTNLKKLMMPLLENLSKELKMKALDLCILGMALCCRQHS